MNVNPRAMAVAATIAATGVTGLISINIPRTVTVEAGKTSWAVLKPGGQSGNMYLTECDGGMCAISAPGCVRRKAGGSSLLCMKGLTTLTASVVGELNRFPSNLAQPLINDCEPVACATFQGENADLDEEQIVNQLGGEILP